MPYLLAYMKLNRLYVDTLSEWHNLKYVAWKYGGNIYNQNMVIMIDTSIVTIYSHNDIFRCSIIIEIQIDKTTILISHNIDRKSSQAI